MVDNLRDLIAVAITGVRPADIRFLEMHGIGAAFGDHPVEYAAPSALYAQDGDPRNGLTLAGNKANFGHTESSAGIAGSSSWLCSSGREEAVLEAAVVATKCSTSSSARTRRCREVIRSAVKGRVEPSQEGATLGTPVVDQPHRAQAGEVAREGYDLPRRAPTRSPRGSFLDRQNTPMDLRPTSGEPSSSGHTVSVGPRRQAVLP